MKIVRRIRFRALLTALAVLPLTGCLFRSHPVQTRYSTAVLQSATPAELIAKLNQQAAQVRSLNATVDIDTSVGGARKGKVTDYQEIRGYVLVRRPAMIRMIGLFPVLRNKAFDMVSDGSAFRVSIPPKNRFVIGHNEVMHPSQQPLENLRPQHIFDALLLHEVDPQSEIAVVEDGVETVIDPKSKKPVEEPDYVVVIIHRGAQGWYLARKVFFSRQDLMPHRQVVYDPKGNIATDAHYDQLTSYDGVLFPAVIQIRRPQEEYSLVLNIVKLRLNEPLTDEQFALEQPAGSELVDLDQPKEPHNHEGSK
jgi:outer membrane lipoprotein-sorting protein